MLLATKVCPTVPISKKPKNWQLFWFHNVTNITKLSTQNHIIFLSFFFVCSLFFLPLTAFMPKKSNYPHNYFIIIFFCSSSFHILYHFTRFTFTYCIYASSVQFCSIFLPAIHASLLCDVGWIYSIFLTPFLSLNSIQAF